MSELLDALRASARRADAEGATQAETVEALRRSGYLGTLVPGRYGGMGEDALFANRLIERLATADASAAIVLFQHLTVTARILEWGTEEQRGRFLPKLASGEWLAASAWSESGAGASKQRLSTTAKPLPGGDWRLDGAKTFATGAGLADLYLVLVQTGDAQEASSNYGAAGQSFFLVESDRPGIGADTDLDLSGMRGSSTGFVWLDGCVVPPENMLGPLGEAPRVIAGVRESGMTLGAVSVGVAQAALETALAHARKRGMDTQQAVRHALADMQLRVEAARALVERAGRREAPNQGAVTLYSKIFASEASEAVCRQAQQLVGGGGFVRGHLVERLARDARAVAMMGPVNDLAREIASQELIS